MTSKSKGPEKKQVNGSNLLYQSTRPKLPTLRPPSKSTAKPPLQAMAGTQKPMAKAVRDLIGSVNKPNKSQIAPKPYQSKTPSKSREPVQAPKPVVNEEELDPAVREKRIADWRERFKSMHFYFDGVDPLKVAKFRTQIRHLEGVFALFA
jgi:hypothetical protein